MADSDGRAIQIVKVNEQTAQCVVIRENLQIVHRQLEACRVQEVSIVSVMGAWRSGKSFLLGLLLRRFRAEAKAHSTTERDAEWTYSDEEPIQFKPTWLEEGDQDRVRSEVDQGFAWAHGQNTCTQGIWLWSKPLVFQRIVGEGSQTTRIGVLLMDTQGMFDGETPELPSFTLMGLTAVLSSKLIYNVSNILSADLFAHLDTVAKMVRCIGPDARAKPFGHLHFLVRDWEYGDPVQRRSLEQCEHMLTDHLNRFIPPPGQTAPKEFTDKADRLRAVFNHPIRCSGLCYPGLAVKPHKNGEIRLIDNNFFKLLDDFTNQLIDSDFPRPSAPYGTTITVGNFVELVERYAKDFQDKGSDVVINHHDAFVKVFVTGIAFKLVEEFKGGLRGHSPGEAVPRGDLAEFSEGRKHTYLKNFEKTCRNSGLICHGVIEGTFTKDPSEDLGLGFSHSADEKCLKVKGGGVTVICIDSWNRANPDKTVEAGDLLIEINGVKNDSEKMLEQINEASSIVFKKQKEEEYRFSERIDEEIEHKRELNEILIDKKMLRYIVLLESEFKRELHEATPDNGVRLDTCLPCMPTPKDKVVDPDKLQRKITELTQNYNEMLDAEGERLGLSGAEVDDNYRGKLKKELESATANMMTMMTMENQIRMANAKGKLVRAPFVGLVVVDCVLFHHVILCVGIAGGVAYVGYGSWDRRRKEAADAAEAEPGCINDTIMRGMAKDAIEFLPQQEYDLRLAARTIYPKDARSSSSRPSRSVQPPR